MQGDLYPSSSLSLECSVRNVMGRGRENRPLSSSLDFFGETEDKETFSSPHSSKVRDFLSSSSLRRWLSPQGDGGDGSSSFEFREEYHSAEKKTRSLFRASLVPLSPFLLFFALALSLFPKCLL